MKSNSFKFFLTAILAIACLSCMAAFGAESDKAPFPTRRFTAIYHYSVDGAKTMEHGRMHSDGKGHLLMAYRTFVRLEDYVHHSCYTQVDACLPRKESSPVDTNPFFAALQMNEQLFIWSNDLAQRKLTFVDHWWKSMHDDKISKLKDVDGHACHVWLNKSNYWPAGDFCRCVWFDQESGCLVRQGDSPDSKKLTPGTVVLVSLSDCSLPDNAFTMPITDPALWEKVTGQKPNRARSIHTN